MPIHNVIKYASTEGKDDDNQNAVSMAETAEIHDILSNERRRLVIDYLIENQSAELPELAEYVGTEIEGRSITSNDDAYDSYRVTLHQTHLDKLADAGVVAFERKSGEIRLGANAEAVVEFMPHVTLNDEEKANLTERLTSFLLLFVHGFPSVFLA